MEKGGIPVAGIMSADEMEDYLELQDPQVQRAQSSRVRHDERTFFYPSNCLV
ncbi:MAG: hypothetical protein ACR2NN_07270 [Bryobacteraceae bacterium]